MIPEYIRFYGGTPREVLAEYAITFFAMLNAMYQIKANETLNAILAAATAQSGEKSSGVIDSLKKQSQGLSKILEEVRSIKK